MQSFLFFIAAVSAAAAATIPVAVDQPSSSETQYPITSSEYLRKIIGESSVVIAGSRLVAAGNVVSLLRSLDLVEAATIAEQVNLNQVLTEDGSESYTLFAPTDKAVRTWKELVPDVASDQDSLADLCKAWIVQRRFQSSEIEDEKVVTSMQGAPLRFNIYKQAKTVTVNGAEIVEVDNQAGSLFVHVVDKVLYPLAEDTILNTLAMLDRFSMFVDLFRQTTLEQEMGSYHGWTIIAPFNEAFMLLPHGVLRDLVADQAKLEQFLRYYMVKGTYYSAGLVDGQNVEALDENQITFNYDKKGELYVNKNSVDQASQARIMYSDLPATDGVFHVIDRVIMPPQRHLTYQS